MQKPALSFWNIFNMSFGFFGIQMAFALQGGHASRVFQTLGAEDSSLAIFWLAGPLTGLIVQPLVGHFSDRTWGPLGRRRPYFLAGAILTTLALFIMPNSPVLWMAVVMLWVLDASINIAMEPFRAFIGDMLPSRQRTQGFATQTIFIGAGGALGAAMPQVLTDYFGVASTAPEGQIPDAVIYSFYFVGVCLFLAVGWTVLRSREYSPKELEAFQEPVEEIGENAEQEVVKERSASFFLINGFSILMAGVIATLAIYRFEAPESFYVLSGTAIGLALLFLGHGAFKLRGRVENVVSHIAVDLVAMPKVMRRLAVVQFFSWISFFIMWVYQTTAVTAFHYGTSDPTSVAYNEGANWVGTLGSVYAAVSALWALVLPFLAARFNRRIAHGFSLLAGAAGFASYYLVPDPQWLALSMVGVGMAWGSILTMPYAILSDALPVKKMGTYMGIFNFFIVLPQMVVAGVMGAVLERMLGGQAILTYLVAGGSMVLAAAALALVPGKGKIIPAKVG